MSGHSTKLKTTFTRTAGLRLFAALLLGAAGMSIPPLAAAPPMEGTVSVDVTGVEAGQDISPDQLRDAASSALSDKGFTLLDDAGHAAFTMALAVRLSDVGTGTAAIPTQGPDVMKDGVAGAVGSGVRIAVPSRKSRLVALERTQLDMTLRKRGSDAPVWHGTAVTVRSADARASALAALCDALMRAYPAQSDAVIGVP